MMDIIKKFAPCRYIQGVRSNSRYLSVNTDSATLRSTPAAATPPPPKAGEWFAPKAIKTLEDDGGRLSDPAVIDALWALRDHMIKDSVQLRDYVHRFN